VAILPLVLEQEEWGVTKTSVFWTPTFTHFIDTRRDIPGRTLLSVYSEIKMPSKTSLQAPRSRAKNLARNALKNRPKKRAKKLTGNVEITRAVAYTRVSTSEQADSGLSLEHQEARIRAHCEAKGWELLSVFSDPGVSGSDLNRKGLKRAVRALSPGTILLAAKLDRLTRSVPDTYTLDAMVEDKGSAWATVAESFDTSTVMGRAMRTLIATFAEMERGRGIERTVEALQQKKARGERLGATPLGYRTLTGADGGKIVVEDSAEMETVRLVREMHQAGQGLREIARHLTAMGRKTKRGGEWQAVTVKRLLQTRYIEGIS
jgi:site-specific DNA recombinase